MAFRNRIEFICNNALIPQLMVRLGGENNNVVRQNIVISRCDQAGRSLMDITNETRICNNCNINCITILRKIKILENDSQCMRLNVLFQTFLQICLVCNARHGIHKLSLKCWIDIFVKKNIYVAENYLCCNDHLNEMGLLSDILFQGFRYINRPYILKGQQLQIFLQSFCEQIIYLSRHGFDNKNCFTENEFNISYKQTTVYRVIHLLWSNAI